MGGGSYDREVYTSTTSSGGYAHSAVSSQKVGSKKLNQELLPLKRRLKCAHQNPIVLELDATGSNIAAANVFYDKMPMFFGQLIQQGLLLDPSVSFAVNGDAQWDNYPLQVCDFKEGVALDDDLGKVVLEGGGGSNSVESYELPAWFYANRCELPEDCYPFYFLLADEGVYTELNPETAKDVFGVTLKKPAQTKDIFKKLQEKFKGNVFLVHLPYGWSDQQVVMQWIELLGADHVLCVNDPKAMIDVILGAIAIASGKRTLDEYAADMAERGQTQTRIKLVSKALKDVVPSEARMPEPEPISEEVASGGPGWV